MKQRTKLVGVLFLVCGLVLAFLHFLIPEEQAGSLVQAPETVESLFSLPVDWKMSHKFQSLHARVVMSSEQICEVSTIVSQHLHEAESKSLAPSWSPGNTIKVMMMDGFTTHHAGIHKLIRLPGNTRNCLLDKEDCDLVIENCPVRCEWKGYNEHDIGNSQVLFYHSDLPKSKTPIIPLPGQAVASIGHEPTFDNYAKWRNASFTARLDFTVHWGRGSDVPVHFYYFDALEFGKDPGEWWKLAQPQLQWKNITTHWKFGTGVPVEDRLVSAVVGTNCKTLERYTFLKRFSELMGVASYGNCLNNADGDHKKVKHKTHKLLGDISEVMQQKLDFIERHPFHLALESTNLDAGFVTEKVFQCLLAGVVPIYWGPSDVINMVPPESIINYADFRSVEELVRHVKKVASSEELYFKYHKWRYELNVAQYFEWTKLENRINAPCRVCQYFHSHWQTFVTHENRKDRLYWDEKEGWKRKPDPCFMVSERLDHNLFTD